MKERKIRLTKGQHEQLLNQHIGTGIIFYKSADNETTTIEFCTGKDGKLYTMSGYKLNIEQEVVNSLEE